MPIRSVQLMASQDSNDPNSKTLVAEIERFSENLVVKGDIHADIHKGIFFSTGTSDTALAGGASLEILIQTPADTPRIHARFQAAMGSDASTALFEGTTFSDAGTLITPTNRNRASATVAGGTWSTGPTLTADGSQIFSGVIPGGSGGNALGGSVASFEEFILAAGSTYLARVTNLTGQVQVAYLAVDFYDTGLTPYA